MAENERRVCVSELPLSRSELRSMDGETVWVEILNHKVQKVVGTKHDFGIIRSDKFSDEFFVEMLKYNYSLYQVGYGDVWIAYRPVRRKHVKTEETINNLRACQTLSCKKCSYRNSPLDCTMKLARDAADEIERLLDVARGNKEDTDGKVD